MGKYWLMDQHGDSGPTALVDTDGRLQIVDVVRFGPSLTDLEDQQRIWDQVMGRVVLTLKPHVDAASIDDPGVAPLEKLRRVAPGTAGPAGRGGTFGQGGGAGHASGGPSRKRSRGDR